MRSMELDKGERDRKSDKIDWSPRFAVCILSKMTLFHFSTIKWYIFAHFLSHARYSTQAHVFMAHIRSLALTMFHWADNFSIYSAFIPSGYWVFHFNINLNASPFRCDQIPNRFYFSDIFVFFRSRSTPAKYFWLTFRNSELKKIPFINESKRANPIAHLAKSIHFDSVFTSFRLIEPDHRICDGETLWFQA